MGSIVEEVSEVLSEDIVGGACTDEGDLDIQGYGKGGRAQGGLGPIAVFFISNIGHAPCNRPVGIQKDKRQRGV